MLNMYDMLCKVLRAGNTLGQYNRPSKTLVEIAQYDCKLIRKNVSVVSGEPQMVTMGGFRMYTYPEADIKAGDTIVINNMEFKASTPFPYRTHMEVDLTLTKEV